MSLQPATFTGTAPLGITIIDVTNVGIPGASPAPSPAPSGVSLSSSFFPVPAPRLCPLLLSFCRAALAGAALLHGLLLALVDTGKTMLCKALAWKLPVRLSFRFVTRSCADDELIHRRKGAPVDVEVPKVPHHAKRCIAHMCAAYIAGGRCVHKQVLLFACRYPPGPRGQLIEVNSRSLYSKWVGMSSEMVSHLSAAARTRSCQGPAQEAAPSQLHCHTV